MNFSENLEVLQPQGEDKVYFRCRVHNYWGSTKAPMSVGCPACWGAHYIVVYGKYKTREGESEMFEEVLKNAVAELEKHGEWDVALLPHVEIEREAQ